MWGNGGEGGEWSKAWGGETSSFSQLKGSGERGSGKRRLWKTHEPNKAEKCSGGSKVAEKATCVFDKRSKELKI